MAEEVEEWTENWRKAKALLLALSVFFCVPKAVDGIKGLARKHPVFRLAAACVLILLSIASLAKSTFNPFLYFRF